MLTFIRSLINTRFGAAIALIFVAVIGIGFVLTDKAGLSGSGSSVAKGDVVATVGGKTISVADLNAAGRRDFDRYRQEQPTLDMAQFIAGGGLDATLDRLIDSTAYRQFAENQGMVVSKKAVDGVIAQQPVTFGLDGKFSQEKYDAALRQSGTTDAEVRIQTRDQILVGQMWQSLSKANYVPTQLALPYASMLLQQRSGLIGFIPSAALTSGPAPTDAELKAFYSRNAALYRLPERRIVRYAVVNTATVAAAATPTPAEIAAAYRAQSAKYAAADVRTITQVVVGDQAAAAGLAAKVRAGTPIEQAARGLGLEPATVTDTQKAAYAAQTAPAVAEAAFAAKLGDVVGPVRGPLGFIVAKIVKQHLQPTTTLAAATPALTAEVAKQKVATALTDKRNAFEDALSKTSFDGIVAKNALTPVQTPALLQSGQNVDDPTSKPDPILQPILAAAFAAQAGDTPQTVPLGPDGSFALVALAKIVPPAVRPLAEIREAVVRDFTIDRAQRAARQVAASVVAAASKGTPLAAAMAATKLKLPPIKPVSGPRAALMANPRQVPPPVQLLFAMAPKTTKLLEAPNKAGFFVIHLDVIVPGDATRSAPTITGTQADIGGTIGREYVEQLSKAVEKAVGVTRNAGALAKLKSDLIGGTGAADQP